MVDRKKIVVIGAGFGGLSAVKGLKNVEADITLIDKRNHHLFQPLLYQVATAGLSAADIAWPIRSILAKQENVRVVLGDVTNVDTDKKQVESQVGNFTYDYLIIASGARHSYFGNDHWEPSAPGLKRIIDATEIRKRVLIAFELAETAATEEERRRYLTFFIVGGGPTGVEMAGAIAELANHALAKEFRSIDPGSARIVLAQGADRLLPAFNEDLSAYAKEALEKLGVEVILDKIVAVNGNDGVTIDEEDIPSATVIWAAGVYVPRVSNWLNNKEDRAGRIPVGEDLTVENLPEVYVIGDAAMVSWKDGTVPGIAPAAKQAGVYVAKAIHAKLGSGKDPGDFKYSHKGNLATIGRHSAVVDFGGKMRFKGGFAWWLWGIAHIYFLIGVRAPFIVGSQWFWSYITFGKGARLITGVMPLFETPDDKKSG